MQNRSNEAPMDFEWQTRAPGDATSPFYQLALKNEHANARRTFASPIKPQAPAPREQPAQSKNLTQPSFANVNLTRGSSFTTPRKLDADVSSGAENLSSPEHADNDETPEQPSKATRRNSLFNLYGIYAPAAPSSGRGEVPRSNKFSNSLVKKVQKRRRRDRELRHIRHASEDSSDDRPSSRELDRKPGKAQQSNQIENTSHIPYLSRLFTFLETHPHIPRILSYYAQFTFNLIIAFLILYVIVAFLLAIKHDVEIASESQSADILAEIATCTKNYVENRCGDPDGRRLPALETVCDNWERCMHRDPAKVGRARVSAQTLAEIFNGFIEPISFKAMFFFISSIAACVTVSNLTFSFFRNKSNNPPHMPPGYTGYSPPPHMPSQQAHVSSYTSGHSRLETENPFFSQPPHRGVFRDDQGPEGRPQRRLELGPPSGYASQDHLRTPSPIKQRKFM
ncbi:nuclear envelope protein Brr6, putative [Trichophyton verrucosum HKI 0517]|uniref:Nuclear envelope protein Brr6, putative n=1 Tax=Trichophyton verrucosum (strain HKI 0517) TaxID=663202 RepID=D4DJW0_TRIVH|nr:nuclear envelope protein Brr6, putative [Trichophyton verrucosum HKI 0517]EFE37887.1 nuclear envelope protein Brr6, putative [Trichophyton verrucosum HKI 0517]